MSDSNSTMLSGMEQMTQAIAEAVKTEVMPVIDTKLAEVAEALEVAKSGATLTVTSVPEGDSKGKGAKSVKLSGDKHKKLPDLIKLVSADLAVLLVGSAGTGKTTACEQTATALGLDFYSMSVGAQTSKADLLGYMSASGIYVSTNFRRAYESGGLFNLDEIDAGNPNVLVLLNSALSNGYCSFPDGMVKRHKSFRLVACANTFGLGASRQYVGRNQLDAATLDRFVVLEFDIDKRLEAKFVTSFGGANAGESGTVGAQWLAVVLAVRKYVDSEGIRAIVSPRATIKGLAMLKSGFTYQEALKATILSGMSADKHTYVTELAKKTWNGDTSGAGSETAGSETESDAELTESPF